MDEQQEEFRDRALCYLSLVCGLTYATALLLIISLALAAALYFTKNNDLCHSVDAKYQFVIQHADVPAQGDE